MYKRQAFFKAIKFAKKFQIFNIGCNRPIKINKIANIIGGKKIYIPKRPGEPEKTHANINKAIKLMKEDDILLIAGKGHEKVQEIRGKAIPFDDFKVVKEAIAKVSLI